MYIDTAGWIQSMWISSKQMNKIAYDISHVNVKLEQIDSGSKTMELYPKEFQSVEARMRYILA